MKNTNMKLIIVVALIALLLPMAFAGTATRSFSPDPATQGNTVTVTITATPAAGELFYAIDEKVPAGWIISDVGSFRQNGQNLKLALTSIPASPVHSYVVTAPTTATSGVFTGGVIFQGSTTALPGASTLSVVAAPTCGDGNIDAGEECDGTNFGTATCASEVGAGSRGSLSCDPVTCQIDTSACTAPTPTTENTPALCQDRNDNDGDGRIDCQDTQCHGATIGVCSNLADGSFCYDSSMCASGSCVSGTCAVATTPPPATSCTDNQDVAASGCTCDGARDEVRGLCTPTVQEISNTLNDNSLSVGQIISQVVASLRNFMTAAGLI